jgi:CheY-like chemotaxis protein
MPSRLAGDGRVLLVDDDATVRRFFVRALTRAGFEVVEAHDGPGSPSISRPWWSWTTACPA